MGYFGNHWWMEYEKYFQEIDCKQPTMVMNTVLNRSLVLLPYPDKHVGLMLYLCIYVLIIYFTEWQTIHI